MTWCGGRLGWAGWVGDGAWKARGGVGLRTVYRIPIVPRKLVVEVSREEAGGSAQPKTGNPRKDVGKDNPAKKTKQCGGLGA